MSAYRAQEPRAPLVMRIALLPTWLLAAVAALIVGSFAIAHLLTREVSIRCARGDDVGAWSCEVRERRIGFEQSLGSITVEVPRSLASGVGPEPISFKPLDDGGGIARVSDRELARFSLREVGAARRAIRDLSNDLGEAGKRSAEALVRVPPGDGLLLLCALPLLALAALWGFCRPTTLVVDADEGVLRVEQRTSPLSSSSLSASLARVQGVTPGPDLDLALSFTDGTVHRIAPVAWTSAATARRARELREAIEASAP